MTPRTLPWVTGGVAALSTAFLLSALPLWYLSRHTVPGGWNVPDVFEELTYPSRIVRASPTAKSTMQKWNQPCTLQPRV